ncbi:MAG: hypothetical protein ABSG67_18675 [Thermoguttaceae bacterium]
MVFKKKNNKLANSRGRRLVFDQLENRMLLSISYPVDPSAVVVDNGSLTANFIPVDNLTIDSNATVNLTPLSGNPTEDLSVKNATNDGSLNITGGDKTIGTISGTGNTSISDGSTLTVTSISQNTLTIGAGATLVIATLPGGPLPAPPNTTGSTPAPADMSATMDSGTLTYNSDALPNLSTTNSPTLVCTDPPDVRNAWRSTTNTPGGDQIFYDVFGDDGSVASRNSDPSTWPVYDPNSPDIRTLGPLTVYENRFGQTIAAEQSYQDLAWNGTITNDSASTAEQLNTNGNVILYGEDAINSITPEANALVVTPSNQGVTTNSSYYHQQLSDIQINNDGVEQADVHNYGSQLQVEMGGDVFTIPDSNSSPMNNSDHSNSLIEPLADRPGFEQQVVHGTSWFNSFFGGTYATGDWGQPADTSIGSVNWGSGLRTVNIFVGLLPTRPGHINCNTIMYSGTDSFNSHAGAYELSIINWPPGTQKTIEVDVKITMCLIANSAGKGSGGIDWKIQEGDSSDIVASDNMGVVPGTPIPNGKYALGTEEFSLQPVVTADSNGRAKVIRIWPEMKNNGPGEVYYLASITWYPVDQLDMTNETKSADSQIVLALALNIKTNIDTNSILNFNTISDSKFVIATGHDAKHFCRYYQNLKVDAFNNSLQMGWRDDVYGILSQDKDLIVIAPAWFHGLKTQIIEPLFVGVI